MKKINSVILGASGEHYVIAELLRRGFIAAKAPEGVPNFDIVITDIDGAQLSAIQVKTRKATKGGDQGWHMKAKHDHMISKKMFYVFVDIGIDENSQVQFFVMPSRIVADACRVNHEIWEQTPNTKGQPYGESEMRRLLPEYKRNDRMRLTKKQDKFLSDHSKGWLETYRNAWHLLGKSN
jgi:hypothetical protein